MKYRYELKGPKLSRLFETQEQAEGHGANLIREGQLDGFEVWDRATKQMVSRATLERGVPSASEAVSIAERLCEDVLIAPAPERTFK